MTKSSTLVQQVRSGNLTRIGDELIEGDERCLCWVYATTGFVNWRDGSLPSIRGKEKSELSPDEEVDDFLRRFQLGRRATEIARLQPTKHGVWEIRLAQTRLFGWFPEPNVLVLTSGEDIEIVKGLGRKEYDRQRDGVRDVRKKLGLDYVAGDQCVVRTTREDS